MVLRSGWGWSSSATCSRGGARYASLRGATRPALPARERRQHVDPRAERPGVVTTHDPVHEERAWAQHSGHRVAVALEQQGAELADGGGIQRLLAGARGIDGSGE